MRAPLEKSEMPALSIIGNNNRSNANGNIIRKLSGLNILGSKVSNIKFTGQLRAYSNINVSAK